MRIIECDFPSGSQVGRDKVDAAYFRDSYLAPLGHPSASLSDIFFALFGHNPGWIKAALLMRNRMASAFGLAVPKPSDILAPTQTARYKVGDTIGPWPIFSLTDTELVAGRDNRHLDFRLSLMRDYRDGAAGVVVSTVCNVHNLSGKIYLFFVVPFHKWGVKHLIARAVRAGRL